MALLSGYMIYPASSLRAQFGVECNNSKNPVGFSVSFALEAEALIWISVRCDARGEANDRECTRRAPATESNPVLIPLAPEL